VNVLEVEEHFQLFLITQLGKLIRIPVENIRTIGRVTQGNRLIRLETDEQVIGIAPVIEDEDDDEVEVKEENSTDSTTVSAAETAPENLVEENIPEEPQDPSDSNEPSDS
jgi:DNA gyrase subunit A